MSDTDKLTCTCAPTEEQEFRFNFTCLGDETLAQAKCEDCGGIIGRTTAFTWPGWVCICCFRPLELCVDEPCDGRDPDEPWKMRKVEQR